MTSHEVKEFRKDVLKHWKENGRHKLPWRLTKDPYKILVSEVMLQQTQVDRVVPYYRGFLKKFPTVKSLAKAELADVIRIWSGLGYNRRAKFLRDAAIVVVEKHKSKFPESYEALHELPGVGDYTARAVRVFAFSKHDVLIETNVRTAFFKHFHSGASQTISDADLLPLVLEAAKRQDPREWHWALMDYGSHLKRSGVRLNHQSAHYTKQSPFEGSLRQFRGKLLRRLMDGPITKDSLKKIGSKNAYYISMALQGMEQEGLVVKEKEEWRIA